MSEERHLDAAVDTTTLVELPAPRLLTELWTLEDHICRKGIHWLHLAAAVAGVTGLDCADYELIVVDVELCVHIVLLKVLSFFHESFLFLS